MLVVSRQRDESIMIGDEIEVAVVDIRGDKVRLGFSAPRSMPVHRKEVWASLRQHGPAPAVPVDEPVTAEAQILLANLRNALANRDATFLCRADHSILAIECSLGGQWTLCRYEVAEHQKRSLVLSKNIGSFDDRRGAHQAMLNQLASELADVPPTPDADVPTSETSAPV